MGFYYSLHRTYLNLVSDLQLHCQWLVKRTPTTRTIYISSYDGTYMLHVINQPDSFGLACDVQQHAVTLPGPGGNMAVPTFPNYNLGPLVGSPCDTLTGIVSIQKD